MEQLISDRREVVPAELTGDSKKKKKLTYEEREAINKERREKRRAEE